MNALQWNEWTKESHSPCICIYISFCLGLLQPSVRWEHVTSLPVKVKGQRDLTSSFQFTTSHQKPAIIEVMWFISFITLVLKQGHTHAHMAMQWSILLNETKRWLIPNNDNNNILHFIIYKSLNTMFLRTQQKYEVTLTYNNIIQDT